CPVPLVDRSNCGGSPASFPQSVVTCLEDCCRSGGIGLEQYPLGLSRCLGSMNAMPQSVDHHHKYVVRSDSYRPAISANILSPDRHGDHSELQGGHDRRGFSVWPELRYHTSPLPWDRVNIEMG